MSKWKGTFSNKIKISYFICKKNMKLLKYFWNVFRFRIVITVRSRIDVLKRSISMGRDIEWHSKFLKTARPTFFFFLRKYARRSSKKTLTSAFYSDQCRHCDRSVSAEMREVQEQERDGWIIKWRYFGDRGERKKKKKDWINWRINIF